jgi:hypothetical protein
MNTRSGTIVEELRIDGHAESLVPIRGLLVAGDGTIIVGQPQDFRVRFFDARGRPDGSFGRQGRGPGEFVTIRRMGWRADTLWVFDQPVWQVSFISPERELVRTQRVPLDLVSGTADIERIPRTSLYPYPVGVGADGSVFATFASPAGVELPEPFASEYVAGRVAPDGTVTGIVARVQRGRTTVTMPGSLARMPFPIGGFTAASQDADRFAAVYTSLEGQDADTFLLTVRDASGAVVWSRRYPFHRRPMPRSVWDSAYAARLEALSSEMPGIFEQAYREQVRVPPSFPPLDGLLFGRDGTIWVEKTVRDGARPYMVLDADGDVLGRVSIPPHGRVAVAELGTIWVIERDEFDVESVVRYAVTWN